MSEHGEGPAVETRGGKAIDWDAVEPGKPLKEKQPDPDIVRGVEQVTGETYDWETGNWAGEE